MDPFLQAGGGTASNTGTQTASCPNGCLGDPLTFVNDGAAVASAPSVPNISRIPVTNDIRTRGGSFFAERRRTPEPDDSERAAAGPLSKAERFSVRGSMEGAVVLLTGCTGYIGSLVLEQLLRCCPGVSKIYVIVRVRRGLSPEQRVCRLMRMGLFHLVRERPELTSKVVVVCGDMLEPYLGIDRTVLARVLEETTVIIHNAARIALEDPIQTTLRFNYCGTKRLLDLAMCCCRLESFVYVSTAFVNLNRPSGSTVEEQIYPLMYGDQPADHAALVSDIMSKDAKSAEIKAKVCMQLWGYNNTYCLGKHLTEQLVASYHQRCAPVVIVRPTLVLSVAGAPYPGYVGNLAGPAGFLVAFALGFFTKNAAAWHAYNILDTVPGNVVSSLIIAGAAANKVYPTRRAPLILHAASSTINPAAHIEGYAMTWDYFHKYPAPYKLIVGDYWKLHEREKEYVPKPRKLRLAKAITSAKVGVVAKLLSCFGREREAKRLSIGHQAWAEANDTKYDITLYFSIANVLELESHMLPDEQDDFVMAWRGSWLRFQTTYTAALMHRHFKQPPPAVSFIPHDYVHVPDLPKDFDVVLGTTQPLSPSTCAPGECNSLAVDGSSCRQQLQPKGTAPHDMIVVEPGVPVMSCEAC